MIAPIATYFSCLSKSSLMLYLLSAGDPVRDSLQAIVNHLAAKVGWSTAVVAAGVALEIVEPIHDAIAWIKRYHRKKADLHDLKEIAEFIPLNTRYRPKKKKVESAHPNLVKALGRIGIVLVVVGVVGEWRYGSQLEDGHNAVHEYDVRKLTEADQKAGAAKDSADAVGREYDSLLRKYTTAEQELIALKGEHSARRLSSKQKEKLLQRLTGFSDKSISLSCVNAGDEAFDFMKDFVDAFGRQNSPVKLNPWRTGCDRIDGGGGHFPPIGIYAGAARQGDAGILLKALVEIGINKNQISSKPASDTDRLELVIGPHEQWVP
jgi:hypothetical protein